MADLDDPQLYRQCDPTGLGGRIASLPSQCRDAWVKALAFPLPEDYRRVEPNECRIGVDFGRGVSIYKLPF